MRQPCYAGIFVYGVWALLLAAVLAAIALWGRNLPMSEDWNMVAALTGNQSNFAAWLWSQNNEHRMPVPRLVYLFVLRITGGDFRAGMVFNALAVAGVALALLRAVRRLRGGVTHYTDAVLPVLLMNLGHWENLLWGWQMQFTISVGLSCLLLLIIATHADAPDGRSAVAAAACLILLPLCGANGVVMSLVLAPWLAVLGVRALLRDRATAGVHRSASGPTAVVLVGAAALSVLLCGLYFIGFERVRWYPPSPGVLATLRTTAKLVTFGWGPIVSRAWPAAVLATGVWLFSSVLLLLLTRGRKADWPRRVGLLAFLAACLALSLAIGWGRATAPPAPGWGLPMRYALLNVPALCAAWLVWVLYAPARLRSGVGWAVLAVALLLVPLNTRLGLYWRDWYVAAADAVLHDVDSGVPLAVIAEKHQNFLMHWNRTFLLSRIEMLERARLGPFRSRAAGPPGPP